MRRLTVISVSYPFAPVTADPVGGAEQVLAQLDRELTLTGHRSLVIAPSDSRVHGELHAIPSSRAVIDGQRRAMIHAELRARLAALVAAHPDAVVHLHGIDFIDYLPDPGPPVLVSLHLPLSWYPAAALTIMRPRTSLHPVSRSQAAGAPPGVRLAEPVENGVDVTPLTARKRGFALTLGRICPEKGMDDAIDAAGRARMPLLLAGTTFPYVEHQRYFERCIRPRLGRHCRWIGAVAGRQKKRLLAQAACVLVPSKAPETSSLVAMEAMAQGTPVVAYRSGALPEIVEHGRTGFVVDSVQDMALAMRECARLDPAECRRVACRRFPLQRMTTAYLERYAQLAG